MRRRAHLRCRKIERYLDYNNQENVQEALFGLPHVAMAHQKSGPSAHDPHDTAGGADKFGRLDDF
jgi:hypothetical protein